MISSPFLKRAMPPLIPLIILITIFEISAQTGAIPRFILPAPSDVLNSLMADHLEYWTASLNTLFEALSGLGLSIFFGVGIALFFSLSIWLERALYPYAIFFQTVPIISIAPLLVIWFGFGFRTVVVSAFIVSIFPIIASTLAGLGRTDRALLDLFKLYRATTFQTLYKLRLPSALPSILTGVRIAAGLAMIGAIVGEFIAGGGLGGLVDSARTQQRLDKVFAAVLITSFTGILILAMINLLARILFWRFQELED